MITPPLSSGEVISLITHLSNGFVSFHHPLLNDIKYILTFILEFSIIDLKLKNDGSGLDISSGLHENKLCALVERKYEQLSRIKV